MKHIIACLQILECGGNLFDAVSLAVKAALHNTRVPKVKAACMDGGTVDLQFSDDPFDCSCLDVSAAPCLVTLCKVNITWLEWLWAYCLCFWDCLIFVIWMKMKDRVHNRNSWSRFMTMIAEGSPRVVARVRSRESE
jgi:hypothetical protein